MRINWQMFSGEFSDDLCDSIIENFSKLPEIEATTFNGNEDHRKSKVRWVSGENGIKSHLMHYVNQANAHAFQVDIANIVTELQFTEYDAEHGGYYKSHHDIDWQASASYDRKLSIVVQLSDPETYKGGELSFSEVQNPIRSDLRKRGTIIVFPSYLQHEVSPVTEGTRYSLVSWVWGPRWK